MERRLEKALAESPLNFTLLAMQTEGCSATDLCDLVVHAMRSMAHEDVDADAAVRTLSQIVPLRLC